MSRLRLLLDTNFLLIPFQFKVDLPGELKRLLDGEYEIMVPEGVLRELEQLRMNARGRDKRNAASALSLAERFKIVSGERDVDCVDDALLDLAKEDAVICTNDRELRNRAREKGIPVIYLRQKKILELDGHIK